MERYEIAGLKVDMQVSGRTKAQAEPYLSDSAGVADITITVNTERFMQLFPECTDPDMAEYMGSGYKFAVQLLNFNGFRLHASAIILDGKAYLFSAPSGTGKSTHAEKWCRLFGAVYLNDDKPVLRRLPTGWMAYGAPWSGKHDLSLPVGVPLGGIAFLRRGEENTMTRLSPADALPLLMSQSLRQINAQRMDLLLQLLDKLLQEIPVWDLQCRNDDDAAYLSYAHMR